MSLKVGQGRKVVAAAGTAVALESSSHQVLGLIITAELDNADTIAVGGSAVIESDTTRTGVPLAAGDSVTIPDVDLNQVYIDAGTNGEGVTFLYWG